MGNKPVTLRRCCSACVAALRVGPKVNSKQTYLISDRNPMTRRGICESALKNDRYVGLTIPPFLGKADGLKGKIYDGCKSVESLSWEPMFPSFDDFMSRKA